MKVLLLKDIYKLGRAGDVKKVADGYGRNYLLPQGLAVLATPGALKRSDNIRQKAAEQRAIVNKEMGVIADKMVDLTITFSAKASETGKLYGSITTQMIAEAIANKIGVEIARRQIDSQPVRALGEHKVKVRLTVDLIPSIKVIVLREGEAAGQVAEVAQVEAVPAETAPAETAPAETVPAEAPAEAEVEVEQPATQETATPEAAETATEEA
jgi:large subunit ribosomal protein L9